MLNVTRTIAAAVATSFLLAAPAALARPHQGKAAGKRGARRMARLLKGLEKIGVDKKRRDAIQADLKAMKAQKKALWMKAKAAHKELRALLRAKSTDEAAYRRALAKMEQLQVERFKMKQRAHAIMKKHLKPSEQARLLAMKMRHHRKRGHR